MAVIRMTGCAFSSFRVSQQAPVDPDVHQQVEISAQRGNPLRPKMPQHAATQA
jgi:hypothetical protein